MVTQELNYKQKRAKTARAKFAQGCVKHTSKMKKSLHIEKSKAICILFICTFLRKPTEGVFGTKGKPR
jgi:hypothetical protein